MKTHTSQGKSAYDMNITVPLTVHRDDQNMTEGNSAQNFVNMGNQHFQLAVLEDKIFSDINIKNYRAVCRKFSYMRKLTFNSLENFYWLRVDFHLGLNRNENPVVIDKTSNERAVCSLTDRMKNQKTRCSFQVQDI